MGGIQSVVGVPSGVGRPSLKVGVQDGMTFTRVHLLSKKPNSDIGEGAELATVTHSTSRGSQHEQIGIQLKLPAHRHCCDASTSRSVMLKYK
jgi:hypothetical protein